MKYEQRTAKLFEFLYGPNEGLLRRYTKPEHLSEDRARGEINDMVEDINSRIPAAIGDASFDILLGKIRTEIRRRHGSRRWPTISLLLKSTDEALQQIDELSADAGDFESAMVDRLADWYRRHGDCLPNCGKPERTAALVDRGVLTARDAKLAGFPLTKSLQEAADAQPMTEKEIATHIRVSANLWRVSDVEARARLVADGQIPEAQQLDAFAS